MSKKKFIIELGDCDGIPVNELKVYIRNAVDIQRGAMHPDEPIQGFKIISVKSFKEPRESE